jgi:Family of unknown function (DUF6074)
MPAALAHDESLPRTRWFVDGPTPPQIDPPRTGPAQIIPFPVVNRRDFINRAACTHQRLGVTGAVKYLNRLITLHSERLTRLGVAPDWVDADVADLRAATGMVGRP